MACLRATLRATPTAGVEQNTPMFTPGRANRQSAANAGSLVQARDKDAARTAGNRHGEPDRRDLDGVGFMGLLFFWWLIQVAWRESDFVGGNAERLEFFFGSIGGWVFAGGDEDGIGQVGTRRGGRGFRVHALGQGEEEDEGERAGNHDEVR